MNNTLFPTGGKDTGRDPYWVYGLWFRGLGFRGSGFRAGILVHVLGRGVLSLGDLHALSFGSHRGVNSLNTGPSVGPKPETLNPKP